ncbi:MAG TPA: response regulator transcription factor [Gammaproteobacteria bacterium]|nr:response regulator transcription factor [Gammaproteobacteria bacterium]
MRILLVEDDSEAATYLARGLGESGHLPESAADGCDGLARALAGDHDLVIVDRMLPRMDGLEIVRALRRAGRDVPVLVLSALGEVDDRVEGLRAGGDDYLVKPFSFAELLARLEALGRRAHSGLSVPVLAVSDLRLDRLGREVTRSGRKLSLQPREFRLLEYLMLNAGQVVTRTMLLENVWGYHFDPQTNVIDVHISRLRRKIDHGFRNSLLHTVRGAGYCLRES